MNEAAAAVTVRYPQISTKLSNSNKQAEMEVIAEVQNWGAHAVHGVFHAQIPGEWVATAPTVLTCILPFVPYRPNHQPCSTAANHSTLLQERQSL